MVNICLPILLMWKKSKILTAFQGSHTKIKRRKSLQFISIQHLSKHLLSNPWLLGSLGYAFSKYGTIFVKVERRPNRECVFISRLRVNSKLFLVKFAFRSAEVKKECRVLHTHKQTQCCTCLCEFGCCFAIVFILIFQECLKWNWSVRLIQFEYV